MSISRSLIHCTRKQQFGRTDYQFGERDSGELISELNNRLIFQRQTTKVRIVAGF